LIERISSFTYLNATQFLGALNDNIYKLLIVYFLIGLEGVNNSGIILSVTGAVFVIPFLLFSAISGTLADRYSKSTIIILTKILEVVTMVFGLIGFILEWSIGSYLVLFLMATQSALFSPSKYGILPEILPNEKISKANGIMSFFTYLAIILGTFLASFLTDITGRNFVVAAVVCVVIAVIGLLTSFFITYTPPAGSPEKLKLGFVSQIYNTLREIPQKAAAPGVLLSCMMSSAYFLFLGAFAQLNLIPYAVEALGFSDVQGGYLFLCMALGIGLGSYFAGRISGKTVELGLIPLACFALGIGCLLFDTLSPHPILVFPLAGLLGIAGGLFLVPLDSYIQLGSPPKLRGQIIGATNFLSFIGVLLASIAIFIFANVLGLRADQGFVAMGMVTMAFATFLLYQFFDFLSRFVGMVLSRLHFRTTYIGLEKIPEGPAIYVCRHTAWNDTLLMLGAQPRRVRFYIEEVQDHSPFLKRLYYLLRIVHIPEIEPLENNRQCLETIRKTLRKGISVCIFVKDDDVEATIEQLKHSWAFQEVLEELENPMIPVFIDKEVKESDKAKNVLSRLVQKMHWPASIHFGHKQRSWLF
jgi:acyl-[acyl-carrier-protein]-phospholipid O-acyltransferase/long-chain-fatty-acid--[acyl-carrier-protein] ligase